MYQIEISSDEPIVRCSWIDMVKTSRAKTNKTFMCTHRQKEIDELSGKI